ncbi:MAG: G1 family glutamic endopeptidase [Frankiaceae bacterium]
MRIPPVRRTLAALAIAATGLGGALASTPAVATAVSHGPVASHHVGTRVDHHWNSTSSNWAGYAVGAAGTRYTSVSASWVQPAVSCTSTNTWSSFWVGLDGYNSGSVEQTGTEADCSGGRAVYSSWYEMYPKFPVNYSNTVAPGDHFTASVTTNGSGSFTLKLSDTTRGWSHTTTATYNSAALSSAEVIAEAPSSSSGVLPLSNFGTVSFSGSTANGTLFGSLAGRDAITMASGSTTKATPSSISGGSFSVTWHHI